MLLKYTPKSYFLQLYIYSLSITSLLIALQSSCQEHNVYILFSNLAVIIITCLFIQHDNLRSFLLTIIFSLIYTFTTFLFTIRADELNIKCSYFEPYQLGFFGIWAHTVGVIIPAGFLFLVVGFITCCIDKDFV